MSKMIGIFGYTPIRVGAGWVLVPKGLDAAVQARQLLRFVRESHPDIEGDDPIMQVIERYNINVVIDVGANTGQYARRLRAAGYRDRICSVEPVAEIYAALQRQAAADSQWKTYHLALGETHGERNINITANPVFSSFLQTNQEAQKLYGDFSAARAVEKVKLRRLDDCFSEMVSGIGVPRAFIKIDTQGYDIEVCHGALGVMESVVAIQSELSVVPIYNGMPTWIEAIQYFGKMGFVPAAMVPISYDPQTLQVIEFDGLFIRQKPDSLR